MKFAVAALLGLVSAEKVGDLQKCISDIEGMIPDVEAVIADFKAGNKTKALIDLAKLEPEAQTAYADCTAGHKLTAAPAPLGKVQDLPTCISDIEAIIPGVEKVIADVKAGNEAQALSDLMTLAPEAQKAYTDCVGAVKQPESQCLTDLEAIVPDAESLIADIKAGNYTKALTDAMAILPEVEKAYTDCLGKTIHFKIPQKVEDLPTCIADIEALIPGVEKVIADVKAGNEAAALSDLLALEPQAQKAYTDCLSGKTTFLPDSQCLTDLEAIVPDAESLIADIKAGNYTKALTDAMAILPEVEKAYTDCLGKTVHFKIPQNVEDLPTCIQEIEALIPDVESVIADLKAGNQTKAMLDLLKLEPAAKKAYADCTAGKTNFLPDSQCLTDLEAIVPDAESLIADIKAGNYTKALTDAMSILPEVEKAYTDCLGKKIDIKIPQKVEDLPTCIADIEALIPGVEKVIADVKAGNEAAALSDLLALEPQAQKAYSDCLSGSTKGPLGDLPTCIADIEALIPGVEKVIADVKAGNEAAALSDLLALEPQAQKAYSDCLSGHLKGHMFKRMGKMWKKVNKVGDLATCIQDIEGLIPGVEKVIADVKAGNEAAALSDLLALEPQAQKAYTDCLSGAKHMKKKVAHALMADPDPKREYFEKMGAQFASGFYAGAKVGEFDEIDLYECLHREPTSVEYFYKADMALKESWIKKDPGMAVKALDELIGFIVELVMEDYPHTHTEVCKEFQSKEAHWDDLKKILEDEKAPDTTLQAHDDKLFFNKQDITTDAHNMVEDYLKNEFRHLGYRLADSMDKASKEGNNLFLY